VKLPTSRENMIRTAAPAAIANVLKGMGPERRIKGFDQML
jgi:hypothetical protein